MGRCELLLVLLATAANCSQVYASEPYAASVGRYHSPEFEPGSLARSELPSAPAVRISSATVTLESDEDFDGYHHRLHTLFDVDVDGSIAEFYARLYIGGEGVAETLLFTTPEFTAAYATPADQYQITTTLNGDFPSNLYQLRLELFQAGTSDPVASRSAREDPGLAGVPLESRQYEVFHPPLHSIHSVVLSLNGDRDLDGHYRNLHIDVDADTALDADQVFLQFLLRDSGGDWWVLETTPTFAIHNYSSLDTYHLYGSLPAYLYFDYYDLRVELFEAGTGNFLAGYGPTIEHSDLPLESPYDDAGHAVFVHGTADLDWFLTCVLVLAIISRLRKRRRS